MSAHLKMRSAKTISNQTECVKLQVSESSKVRSFFFLVVVVAVLQFCCAFCLFFSFHIFRCSFSFPGHLHFARRLCAVCVCVLYMCDANIYIRRVMNIFLICTSWRCTRFDGEHRSNCSVTHRIDCNRANKCI